ncbi:MAG: hypothetical protein M1831_000337 [Alyxoria varia]|nr:MAG: hypothetical protein M1831_000337 [Alyxoria varia]
MSGTDQAYPSSTNVQPTLRGEPKPSTRQDPPPGATAAVAEHAAKDPELTSNPVFQKPKPANDSLQDASEKLGPGAGGGEGGSSTGDVSGSTGDSGKKGLGEKIKEKVKGT